MGFYDIFTRANLLSSLAVERGRFRRSRTLDRPRTTIHPPFSRTKIKCERR